jgi:hypothetical protein
MVEFASPSEPPDPMSRQLVDATLGRPVTHARERKALPISKEDLVRFAGVYDLGPTLSLTIAVAGDGLTSQINKRPAAGLMYQGFRTAIRGSTWRH